MEAARAGDLAILAMAVYAVLVVCSPWAATALLGDAEAGFAAARVLSECGLFACVAWTVHGRRFSE